YSLPLYSGGGLGWGFFFSVQNSALINIPHPAPPPEYKGRELRFVSSLLAATLMRLVLSLA
ncbi:MAG TPA: hypothetical protein VGG19_05980, partial [Tepidisphaeraceae bacterium]